MHFEHRYFENERKEPESRWRLKPNSIPTLFYAAAPAMPEETVRVQAYVHNGKYFQCVEAKVQLNSTVVENQKASKLRTMLQDRPKRVVVDNSEHECSVTISSPPAQPNLSNQSRQNSVSNRVNRVLAPKPSMDTCTEQVNVCYLKAERSSPDTPVIIELLNRSQVKHLPNNLKVKIWNDKEPKFVQKACILTALNAPYQLDHQYLGQSRATTVIPSAGATNPNIGAAIAGRPLVTTSSKPQPTSSVHSFTVPSAGMLLHYILL